MILVSPFFLYSHNRNRKVTARVQILFLIGKKMIFSNVNPPRTLAPVKT